MISLNLFTILLSLLYATISNVDSLPSQIKIGILLHEHQPEQEILFRWSLDRVNRKGILRRTKLQGIVKRVSIGDSFDAERKTCDLFEEGVIAVIGPPDEVTVPHVASICDSLDIPHFNVVIKRLEYSSGSGLNNSSLASEIGSISTSRGTSSTDLSVTSPILYAAYLDVVLHVLKWKHFVYVYERDESLYHMQEYLLRKNIRPKDLHMRIIKFEPNKPYRSTFWTLRGRRARLMMLDIDCSNLAAILRHAQQVSMMSEARSYVIICLDTQTINLDDYKFSKTLIVWLNSIDLKSEQLRAIQTDSYARSSGSFRFVPEQLKIESAQIHDAVETIAYALSQMDMSQYIESHEPVSCTRPSKSWPHGSTMVNYISSVDFPGMTGRVTFDPMGDRTNHVMNILRLTERGPITVGNWSDSAKHRINVDPNEVSLLSRGDKTLIDSSEARDTLVVVSIRNEPYFMNKQTTKVETGNSRYEGYAIDLIDELSRIVDFDYVFKEVDDGKYGKFDENTKQWNGMIREVMIGKADLAIADLSITSSREDAVDFTLPFMSTGISILFKKPTTKELEFFSFLSPFENHVWFYVGGAYMGVSFLLFIVGRVSPYEWADPHPCRKEDKILRNQFSIMNSFWFTMAAVMQQGSDLAPRSLSTRLVSAIWYFFTLIMISSYTANLAAFLTVEKVVYPIEKAEDLYRHPQNIKYGCVESGSTHTFFQQSKPSSTFRRMFDEMVLVKSSEQGKAEVEKGNYAFFMESTSIEYTIERNCNLTRIGSLLDSKGYGIAIAKNSTRRRDYRTRLSEAILSLQESGMLEILKNRWWKEKRGGGACDIDDGQGGEGVKELTLANVGGVFAIVLIGITIGFILCALELYAKSHRLAVLQGTSKWSQLKRRVRFALDLQDNY